MALENLLLLLVAFAIGVIFLVTLGKCLDEVRPANRMISTGAIWLNLVPLFKLYWAFHTVVRMSQSLRNEARSRPVDFGDGGKSRDWPRPRH